MRKRKILSLMAATALAVSSLTACGGSNSTPETSASTAETTKAAGESSGAEAEEETLPSFEGQELRISTFSFNAELLQKNVYDPFMEKTGCKLIVEGGKNAERVTKIKEAPGNYDIVIIGDAFIADLIDAGLIDTVDKSKLTNLDALYDAAKAPFGEEYGPAYTFNRLGIVYDDAAVATDITSWADLWSPEMKDSLVIPDITATTGPLFYYSVAKMLNLTPGKDDDAIFAKLAELKPNIVKTYTSANDAINMLNQGEVTAAVLLDYSYTEAKKANENYLWIDPSEGSYSGYNTINIIKDCKNKELAEAFVNFYISKEVQLAEALDGVDSPVRKDVELTPEQAANFTYGADMINSLILPDWSVINENKAQWTQRWNELFSTK